MTAPLPASQRLPVVQQNEIAECGLACLTMIARYHGHDVDLAGMRRRFPVSLKGVGLARLMSIAASLGFESRPLRVEPEHLAELRAPCILHWDLNHFVVLKRVRGDRIELHDPARGAVTLTRAEFGRHFTGVALEIAPSAAFAPVRERRPVSLRALVGQVSGLPRAAVQVLLLAVALELFTLALPLALQWTIDLVLVGGDLDLLALIGIGFAVVVLFQAAIAAMRGWLVADLGAALNAQWAANLFSHLLRLPLAFFEKRSVGGVLSRFLSVQSVQQTLTGSFVEGVLDGATALLVLALLALYSVPLALLVAGCFALYALLRWIGYRRLQRLKEEQLVFVARQQSQMIESITGMQAIKLGNRAPDRAARMANATHEVARREAAIARTTASFAALGKLIFGLQRIALIWIGATLVVRGGFTAGMMVVFVTYAELFAQRGGGLIDKLVEFRLLGMHGERIADIALEPPEPHLHPPYSGPEPRPRIEVEGVSFRYAEDDPWVLRDCSFAIEPGESIAITGPSGCGKTTLAKVLLGLVRPTEGRVRIDGVDIERYGLARYRERFGAVMQDDVLFAGSIADNIAFFDPEASLEAIEAAARTAQIHDDIAAMPMGYESLVGDMGSSLSGGQKQRVLLARALFRRPDVLLLDEATSHLDVEREHAINALVADMAATRIIIAHRPDTVRSAQRVLRMDRGRIAAA
ncbi:peptidase domain-containing ABC transporter [Luteimonas sp. Y-2-2-4F]|nr:peptidase domain-containing ABC transporter [Luteimonas sp. Y-2-2-4F]MCD9030899.1 peptidase domain-containing ABC transporter [Luteimonas sp. Y-2-2-4F]